VGAVVAPLRDFAPGERGFSWMPACCGASTRTGRGVWRAVPRVRGRPSDYDGDSGAALLEAVEAEAREAITQSTATTFYRLEAIA
jgi:hypothetical protein